MPSNLSCERQEHRRPWLLVLAGRPGTGKTTLAANVVRATGAGYLRVDVVESLLAHDQGEVGAAGYAVCHGLARSNLLLGNDVVVDAVNPVPEARASWAQTAADAGADLHVVELHLDDEAEHRRRVEQRTADLDGHRPPTWAEVTASDWTPWDVEPDGPRARIDASDPDEALDQTLRLVDGPLVGLYAFPGELRERLVGAIFDGTKVATTGLLEEYRRTGEELPRVGDEEAVLDSDGKVVCVTRTTTVEVVALGEVTDDHAQAEGEGHADAAAWRRAHEEFWISPEFVADLGDPPLVLNDDTPVVCTRFEVVRRVGAS
ncbi:hypothetical protein GCM10027030_01980 [Luteococcus sediminum]